MFFNHFPQNPQLHVAKFYPVSPYLKLIMVKIGLHGPAINSFCDLCAPGCEPRRPCCVSRHLWSNPPHRTCDQTARRIKRGSERELFILKTGLRQRIKSSRDLTVSASSLTTTRTPGSRRSRRGPACRSRRTRAGHTERHASASVRAVPAESPPRRAPARLARRHASPPGRS